MTSSNPGVSIIEVDPNLNYHDTSDYASGLESDTTSLISVAKSHAFENGRRYHGYKEGKYMVPNDEAEQDRMDLMHHCFLLALNGELIYAPVGENWSPQRIIDLGTGSGIWAMDAADTYPGAEVIGVDLSPIQPQWVPPNLNFIVDDMEDLWPYQDNSFDLIHIRHMAGHINDWPKLYNQAFKALKPGGWIEVQDVCDLCSCDDGSIPDTSYFKRYVDYWEEAISKSNRQFNTVAPGIADALRDVGCENINEKVVKVPVGAWPKRRHDKEMGLFWRQHYLDGAAAYALAPFTRILGWTKEELDEFLLGFYEDMRNPKYHGYAKLYFTCGQKPM